MVTKIRGGPESGSCGTSEPNDPLSRQPHLDELMVGAQRPAMGADDPRGPRQVDVEEVDVDPLKRDRDAVPLAAGRDVESRAPGGVPHARGADERQRFLNPDPVSGHRGQRAFDVGDDARVADAPGGLERSHQRGKHIAHAHGPGAAGRAARR